MPEFINLVGERFGRLVVLSHAKAVHGRHWWLCRCDCGNTAISGSRSLRTGGTRSCGCLNRESHTTHGGSYSSEYRVWINMIIRCHKPTADAYARYGGRGIFVCQRWRKSFANFIADMGARPSLRHTLDRKNNDGMYSPSNCRWATHKQQCRNTSRNRRVSYNGENLTIVEWAERYSITPSALRNRINGGWPIELALTVEVGPVGTNGATSLRRGRDA